MVLISHPLHSPDLSQLPFLFPEVNTAQKGRSLDAKNIRENIPAKLNAAPFDVFNDCFVSTFGNTYKVSCSQRRLL
jgi:hypothetical protein